MYVYYGVVDQVEGLVFSLYCKKMDEKKRIASALLPGS